MDMHDKSRLIHKTIKIVAQLRITIMMKDHYYTKATQRLDVTLMLFSDLTRDLKASFSNEAQRVVFNNTVRMRQQI